MSTWEIFLSTTKTLMKECTDFKNGKTEKVNFNKSMMVNVAYLLGVLDEQSKSTTIMSDSEESEESFEGEEAKNEQLVGRSNKRDYIEHNQKDFLLDVYLPMSQLSYSMESQIQKENSKTNNNPLISVSGNNTTGRGSYEDSPFCEMSFEEVPISMKDSNRVKNKKEKKTHIVLDKKKEEEKKEENKDKGEDEGNEDNNKEIEVNDEHKEDIEANIIIKENESSNEEKKNKEINSKEEVSNEENKPKSVSNEENKSKDNSSNKEDNQKEDNKSEEEKNNQEEVKENNNEQIKEEVNIIKQENNDNKSSNDSLNKIHVIESDSDKEDIPLPSPQLIQTQTEFLNLLENYSQIILPVNSSTKITILQQQNQTALEGNDIEEIENDLYTTLPDKKIETSTALDSSEDLNSSSIIKYRKDFPSHSLWEEQMNQGRSSMRGRKNSIKNVEVEFEPFLNKKTLKNYLEEMNDNYLRYMLFHYQRVKRISNDIFICEEKMFLNLIKVFILEIGISDRKIYEDTLRNLVYKKNNYDFENFLSCFMKILKLRDDNCIIKYKFLLYVTRMGEERLLNRQHLKKFFELIKCKRVYDEELCEDITENLILKYASIYPGEKYLMFPLERIMLVLETFFDNK